ncbi:MAG: aminotransferase class I/II-fold pyridoxal phosphate-dependent enzyme [Castellaniella sp.]
MTTKKCRCWRRSHKPSAALRDTLAGLPARSIVLLHACRHNPTGVDLPSDQWQTEVDEMRKRIARVRAQVHERLQALDSPKG